MLYPRFKVELFKYINEELSPTGSDITDSISGDVSAGVETTKDIFTLSFLNTTNSSGSKTAYLGKNSVLDNRFRVSDNFKIYAWYGIQPSNIDNALILYGELNSYDYKVDENNVSITLKGANRTEELLGTFSPFSSIKGVGSYNRCPDIIISLVNRLRQQNQNRPYNLLYADYDDVLNSNSLVYKYTGSAGGVRHYKSAAYNSNGILQSGSQNYLFPEINYSDTWKPIYFNIEKISTPKYTEDENAGTYMFYVRSLSVLPEYRSDVGSVINDLVWKPVSLISSGSIMEGRDIQAFGLSLDRDKVLNTLIVDCGTDLEGNGIINIAYNLDSIGKNGMKTEYYSESRRIFSLLHTKETSAGSFVGSTIDENGYPEAYPWSMQFQGRKSDGTQTGSPTIVSGKKTFNSTIRDEAEWEAVKEAQEIVDKMGEAVFRVDYELPVGSNNFIPGDLKEFIIPSFGWEGNSKNPSKLLRLRDWTHTFTTAGWNTKIIAKEDEEVISSQLGN